MFIGTDDLDSSKLHHARCVFHGVDLYGSAQRLQQAAKAPVARVDWTWLERRRVQRQGQTRNRCECCCRQQPIAVPQLRSCTWGAVQRRANHAVAH
mmetsp:Transcript_54536/g.126978  ORF Transcript_54536/g.126978 Transcript_54536/m.126978 type:complete len:96 (-) Transcript_54536:65-352(-)